MSDLGTCAERRLPCQKTSSAINRTTLGGIKRDGSLLTALRADYGDFNSLPDTGQLRCGHGRETFVLGVLANLATLRRVLKAFVMKENLFARSPDEFFTTVNTGDTLILVVRRRLRVAGCEDLAV